MRTLAELIADGTVRPAAPRGVLVRTYPSPGVALEVFWPQGWKAWRAHFRLPENVVFEDLPVVAREVQE